MLDSPSESSVESPGVSPVGDALEVEVDQDRCTGDGLCVTYAPEVFEFDIDGLAYVKGTDGELRPEVGARASVPAHLVVEVLNSAEGCPGDCIHVSRAGTDDYVGGPRTTPLLVD
jgi:ferredoxin